jgi:hypothetical protein
MWVALGLITAAAHRPDPQDGEPAPASIEAPE